MNPYWGRRYGGFWSRLMTKGNTAPDGWIIKVGRRGPASSNSVPKRKSIYRLLAQNALGKGYLNGVKRK